MTPLAFVGVARELALLSKDPSTRVGAVIVGPGNEIRASGWNGFPRGVRDLPERYDDRPTKYKFIAHAEANAIANAARAGTPTDGCSLVVTALHPCNECTKMIIGAGIRRIYAPMPDMEGRWASEFEVAARMLQEAGIIVEFYHEDDTACPGH
jgi:dCMP deaminase